MTKQTWTVFRHVGGMGAREAARSGVAVEWAVVKARTVEAAVGKVCERGWEVRSWWAEGRRVHVATGE